MLTLVISPDFRMRTVFILAILLFALFQTNAQVDTITVSDYTKVLVNTDPNGKAYPITSLSESEKAGFFMDKIPEGQIKICHPNELFIWVNGKLLDKISGCKFFDPNVLFDLVESDAIYVSFSSSSSLTGLSCELVVFEELLVVKEKSSEPREMNNTFREFSIVCILILTFFLGFIISSYPGRISYIKERSFTFKVSAYEFINTNFFSAASINLLIFYSLAVGFVSLYLNALLNLDFFEISNNLQEFLLKWILLSLIVFTIFMAKWMVVSLVAKLFKFRSLKDFQMFDFLNFNIVVLIGILLFLLTDFIFNETYYSWVSSTFLFVFPLAVLGFVIWFTLKFVNNSPRRKLVIISYLCATEIIPVIFLMGLFYK